MINMKVTLRKNNKIFILTRVNKYIARKLFKRNKNIWITTCKTVPTDLSFSQYIINNLNNQDFDEIIDKFREEFCLNDYTGLYPSYFVSFDKKRVNNIFTLFFHLFLYILSNSSNNTFIS